MPLPKQVSPNRWTELIDRLVVGVPEGDPPPHVAALGFPPPTRWEPGHVICEWKVDPRMFHDRGALSGAYLAALSDHALALVMMTVLEHDEGFTTSDLRTSFFRPVTGGTLHIEASVVHRGRSMVHAEVVFRRDDGKVAAKGTATQVVLPAPEETA